MQACMLHGSGKERVSNWVKVNVKMDGRPSNCAQLQRAHIDLVKPSLPASQANSHQPESRSIRPFLPSRRHEFLGKEDQRSMPQHSTA